MARTLACAWTLSLLTLVALPGAWATDEIAFEVPLENVIELQLGSKSNQMRFFPGRIVLRAGERYLLSMTNPSPVTHEFASETFASHVVTHYVRFFDSGGNLVGYVVGDVREVELLPGNRVEWMFSTTTAAETIDLICDIPGHRDLGMVGEIQIRPSP